MTHDQVKNLLNDFFDESLTAEENRSIEVHLSECSECSQYLFSLQDLMKHAEKLPRKIKPKIDFWNDIFNVISNIKAESIKQREEIDSIEAEKILKEEKAQKKRKKKVKAEKRVKKETKRVSLSERFNKPIFRYIVLGLALILVLYLAYKFLLAKGEVWEVNKINAINGSRMPFAEVYQDEDIESGNNYRLDIQIPDVGSILLEPDTRIKRLSSNSFSLIHGELTAIKSGAKEFLNVQASNTFINDFFLGGRYKLSFLDKNVKLEVFDGWVSMENEKTKSVVLSDHICEFKSNSGMGLPYNVASSNEFINAVNDYCFINRGREESLISLLSNAKSLDAVTLWNTMLRTNLKQREIIMFTMFNLVGQPLDVTNEGLKMLRADMMQRFLEDIEPKI